MTDDLLRNHGFKNLWIAQSVSLIGSQVTTLAVPLIAALLLDASAFEMGLLGAASFAPFLAFGLLAGVWTDRWPRRQILIVADVGRAALLAIIPVVAFVDLLRIEYLYIIQFLVGTLTLFFDVAHEAYLPSIVAREQLVSGNSKLEMSRSVAFVTGPSLAGGLVQLLTAPITIVFNILSYLISAVFILRIKESSPAQSINKERAGVWTEIREGLQILLGNRFLRPIVARTSTANLFDRVMQAVYVLYVTRELMIEPAVLGLLFGMTGVGAFVGAFAARRIAEHAGLGRAIVYASLLGGAGSLLFPLAGELSGLTMPLLVAGHFFLGMSHPIYNINQISLRQAITPPHARGRVTASGRFLVWGTLPIGMFIGGVLGELIGLRFTLLVGAVGVTLGALFVICSPVKALHTVSDAMGPPDTIGPQLKSASD